MNTWAWGTAARARLRLAKELAAGPFSQEAEDEMGVSGTVFHVAAAPGFCSLLSVPACRHLHASSPIPATHTAWRHRGMRLVRAH